MDSLSLYFLMEQSTKGRRKIKKGMDGVNRHFRTDLVIKVNGLMTQPFGRGIFSQADGGRYEG
jgi:hypothetical protein